MELQLPTKLDRLMHAVAEHRPLRAATQVSLHGVEVLVESSSSSLIARIHAHYRAADGGETSSTSLAERSPSARVVLIEGSAPDLGLSYRAWPRDPQHHASDEFVEIPGGRVVRDPHSGLTYLLGPDLVLAVGPCSQQLPRIVDLIHAAVMERLVVRGGLACRAAGVLMGDAGLVIAGPPRSGKTSLALQLVQHGARWLGLERVLLLGAAPWMRVLGLPDYVGLAPGSLSSISALAPLLSHERRAQLARLAPSDLWALHEPLSFAPQALRAQTGLQPAAASAEPVLRGIVSLAWQPARFGPSHVERTTLADRPELVSWLAKRAGPLCRASGTPQRAQLTDLSAYRERLGDVVVWELRGAVDFDLARELCSSVTASAAVGG